MTSRTGGHGSLGVHVGPQLARLLLRHEFISRPGSRRIHRLGDALAPGAEHTGVVVLGARLLRREQAPGDGQVHQVESVQLAAAHPDAVVGGSAQDGVTPRGAITLQRTAHLSREPLLLLTHEGQLLRDGVEAFADELLGLHDLTLYLFHF